MRKETIGKILGLVAGGGAGAYVGASALDAAIAGTWPLLLVGVLLLLGCCALAVVGGAVGHHIASSLKDDRTGSDPDDNPVNVTRSHAGSTTELR